MKTLYGFSVALVLALFVQNEHVGMVSGEILDMRGQPIAGALVVYTNVDNHKAYSVTTDEVGKFRLIGLFLGTYDVKITRPTGEYIYTGHKQVFGVDKERANVISVDLSLIPTKNSLVPFLGVKADELQKEPWRNVTEATLRNLTPEQRAELRKENGLIADYNMLTPQAQAAIKGQNWPQAAKLLQQLIEIAPFKWELYQNLGITLRSLARFEESVQAFEKGIEVARGNPEEKRDRARLNVVVAQMQLSEGEALVALDKPEAAATQFRLAAELDPKPAMAYLHLCSAEFNSGNADAAIAACTKAIAAEPDRTESYQVIAGILNNLDRYQEAIHAYDKGIAVAEENIRAARPSIKSNINSRQIADPSRAKAEAVRAGQMMQSMGNIYFHLKNYSKAVAAFTQAASSHPYPALPLFNLCATLFDMNNLSGAAAACDRAIEADAKMPEPYFVKASALYGESAKEGKSRASHEMTSALERYLQLAPEGDHAGDARAMLKEIDAK